MPDRSKVNNASKYGKRNNGESNGSVWACAPFMRRFKM